MAHEHTGGVNRERLVGVVLGVALGLSTQLFAHLGTDAAIVLIAGLVAVAIVLVRSDG